MSKKKKKKKYYQPSTNSAPAFTATSASQSVAATMSTATTAPSVAKAVNDKSAVAYSAHEEEYRTVRSDLIRVALVNGIFLAAVLALYYVNKSNPFLADWYSKIF